MAVNKVSGLFMAFIIALSLTGLVYAHWSDTIKIEGKLEMAHIGIQIKSYKALLPKEDKDGNIEAEISEDGHLLTITWTNLGPDRYAWIGLVIQNQGSLPAYVKAPEYIFEGPDGFDDYFETKEWFYGPYSEKTGFGTLEIWGKVAISEEGPLKPDGTVTVTDMLHDPPVPTDPYEKVVVWIWIYCDEEIPPDAQGETVILYISIVDDPAI